MRSISHVYVVEIASCVVFSRSEVTSMGKNNWGNLNEQFFYDMKKNNMSCMLYKIVIKFWFILFDI